MGDDKKQLGYGFQGKRQLGVSKVEEVVSTRRKRNKITVRVSKQRPMSKSPLFYKYDIAKYDLHPNFFFDDIADSIPSGVPEYIDDGSQYV